MLSFAEIPLRSKNNGVMVLTVCVYKYREVSGMSNLTDMV
jgi:hypothetical protein